MNKRILFFRERVFKLSPYHTCVFDLVNKVEPAEWVALFSHDVAWLRATSPTLVLRFFGRLPRKDDENMIDKLHFREIIGLVGSPFYNTNFENAKPLHIQNVYIQEKMECT